MRGTSCDYIGDSSPFAIRCLRRISTGFVSIVGHYGLVKICMVPELSKQVIKLAQGVQLAYGLDPHDALLFASLDLALRELGDGPKVFANKNSLLAVKCSLSMKRLLVSIGCCHCL
jgi:hypothetical protein